MNDANPKIIVVWATKEDGNANALEGLELPINEGLVLKILHESENRPLGNESVTIGAQSDTEQDSPSALLPKWYDVMVERSHKLFTQKA